MAGAATNPDPEVFAYAAGQVAHCMDVTHRLGGHNYVLWGGREGYDTLLNTDMQRELDQLGRFLNLVVEHKHRDRLRGHDPHRAEAVRADQAPVRLRRGRRLRVPAALRPRARDQGQHRGQPRHARRGTTSRTRSPSAVNAGIFGSIDANAGDDRLGWDLDRFPVSVEQMTLGMLEILRGGGFTTGGLNFDAKLRRQSIARDDLFIAHIGGMDTMAHALLAAAADHRVAASSTASATPATPDGRRRSATELLKGSHTLADLYQRSLGAARTRAGVRPAGAAREPRRPLRRAGALIRAYARGRPRAGRSGRRRPAPRPRVRSDPAGSPG